MSTAAAPRPVVAITQARIGSSRLPGKVLLPLRGQPLLWWHLTRLKQARRLDAIVVATTEEPGAAAIVELAGRLGLAAFRGPLDDVLARFVGAAALAGAATVVRVTSDCPLIDPALVDLAVETYAAAQPGCSYLSLDVARYPRGLDCEVFSRAALDAAARAAVAGPDREHVTPLIRREAGAAARYLAPDPPVGPQRWCVDTAEDFALVERIIAGLGDRPDFGWRDAAALVDRHPDWRALNADVVQKPVA